MNAEAAAFGRYAQYYDLLYAKKDYQRECEVVAAAVQRVSTRDVRSLLDVGCGTGGHLVHFGVTGWELTGADISPGMLSVAKAKTSAAGVSVHLHQQDARHLQLGRTFDVVTCMFAAFSYMTTNDDVSDALASFRRHLPRGGVLAMDFWYGPAVLTTRPEVREMMVERDGLEVRRKASPRLNQRDQTCNVKYQLVVRRDGTIVDQLVENHVMRYFFPREMEYFLGQAGFGLELLSAFPRLDKEPTESDWEAMVVAVAR